MSEPFFEPEKENKPSLIILDEVDGTSDYEGKVRKSIKIVVIFGVYIE